MLWNFTDICRAVVLFIFPFLRSLLRLILRSLLRLILRSLLRSLALLLNSSMVHFRVRSLLIKLLEMEAARKLLRWEESERQWES